MSIEFVMRFKTYLFQNLDQFNSSRLYKTAIVTGANRTSYYCLCRTFSQKEQCWLTSGGSSTDSIYTSGKSLSVLRPSCRTPLLAVDRNSPSMLPAAAPDFDIFSTLCRSYLSHLLFSVILFDVNIYQYFEMILVSYLIFISLLLFVNVSHFFFFSY
jgi:hypothetical protein